MMYRDKPQGSERERSHARRWVLPQGVRLRTKILLPVLVAVVGLLLFVSMRKSGEDKEARVQKIMEYDDAVVDGKEVKDENVVYRKRILRSEIPEIDYRNIKYRELFDDSNYVQLTAARANGINPKKVGDPQDNKDLVPIFSTKQIRVDTMWHAKPFLVPEAVLLLNFIGHRFSQLMEEHYPELGPHRIIVTSALRTEDSERNLRRVNRNATDTSCHIYGTTFDLSAQRYEHANGHDTVVEACKQMLALALYELRYEGLCYVKYERGSCFHITLRTTQYEGKGKSEVRSYCNPGSPDYLLTKAPPRPAYRPKTIENVEKEIKQEKKRSERKDRKEKREVKEHKTESVPTQGNNIPKITERERLSLEQFERRY